MTDQFELPKNGQIEITWKYAKQNTLSGGPLNLRKCWPPYTRSDISPNMNRSIFYIIGVIVVIVIVLKLLHVF